MPFVAFELADREAGLVMTEFGAAVKVLLSKVVEDGTVLLAPTEDLLSVTSGSEELVRATDGSPFDNGVDENPADIDWFFNPLAVSDVIALDTISFGGFVAPRFWVVVSAGGSGEVALIASLGGVAVPDAWLVADPDGVDHA